MKGGCGVESTPLSAGKLPGPEHTSFKVVLGQEPNSATSLVFCGVTPASPLWHEMGEEFLRGLAGKQPY